MKKINYSFILFKKKRSNIKKTHIYQVIKHNNRHPKQIIHRPNMVINKPTNSLENISKDPKFIKLLKREIEILMNVLHVLETRHLLIMKLLLWSNPWTIIFINKVIPLFLINI